ncbi:hypothetical protein KAH85_05795, partial [Candidatus Bathyarchaeota archaeon]|nr:hypothetical protein [Candidatus Bathyarchaeota archaeon]
MKLRLRKSKLGTSDDEEETEEISVENLAGYLNLDRNPIPEGFHETESYPLKSPFSYASIVQKQETGEYLYIVDELPLMKEEADLHLQVKNILEYELQPPKPEESLEDSFKVQIPEIIEGHRKLFKNIDQISLKKILYYINR